MADLRYYLGPWRWVASGAYWAPPEGTVGLVDLRPLATQARARTSGTRPVGFFCLPTSTTLPSSHRLLGQGDCREIAATSAAQSAWQSLAGYKPQGATLADLLWDFLLAGEPAGALPPPLMPDGRSLSLHLGGHGLVKRERFQYGKHPHTTKVGDVLRLHFRRQFEGADQRRRDMEEVAARIRGFGRGPVLASTRPAIVKHKGRLTQLYDKGLSTDQIADLFAAEAPLAAEHPLRVLDYWVAKYGLSRKRDSEDWKQFVPPDLLPHVPGPLPHRTSVSESFNQANGTTLGPDLTWAEVTGNLDVNSNRARCVSGPARARAESDLSGDDHYAEISAVTATGANGACARYDDTADTCYWATLNNSGAKTVDLFKVVGGTLTLLNSTTLDWSPPTTVRCEAGGSSVSSKVGGTTVVTLTDTAVSGNTRCGFGLQTVGDTADSFSAVDLAVGDAAFGPLGSYFSAARPYIPSLPAPSSGFDRPSERRHLAWMLAGVDRQAVGTSFELPWSVRAAVADSAGLLWGVRAALSDSTQAVWGTRALVVGAAGLPWDVHTLAAASSELAWGVRAPLSSSPQFVWGVRALAGEARELLWDTRRAISGSAELPWGVRAAVSDSGGLVWGVRGLASPSPALVWNVRATASPAYSLLWDVHTTAGGFSELAWGVRAAAAGSREFVWDARAASSASPTLLWNVRAVTSADRDLGWGARALAFASPELLWGTRALVADQAGVVWDTHTLASPARSLRWDVHSLVAVSPQLLWGTRAAVGDSAEFIWNVAGTVTAVGDSFQLVWGVRQPVSDSASLSWGVRAAVGVTPQAVWGVRSSLSGSSSLLWDTRASISGSPELLWDVRKTVSGEGQVLWGVHALTRAELQVLWGVARTTNLTLPTVAFLLYGPRQQALSLYANRSPSFSPLLPSGIDLDLYAPAELPFPLTLPDGPVLSLLR